MYLIQKHNTDKIKQTTAEFENPTSCLFLQIPCLITHCCATRFIDCYCCTQPPTNTNKNPLNKKSTQIVFWLQRQINGVGQMVVTKCLRCKTDEEKQIPAFAAKCFKAKMSLFYLKLFHLVAVVVFSFFQPPTKLYLTNYGGLHICATGMDKA